MKAPRTTKIQMRKPDAESALCEQEIFPLQHLEVEKHVGPRPGAERSPKVIEKTSERKRPAPHQQPWDR